MISPKAFVLSIFAAAVVALAAAVPASASTFCVPGYFAACPNNGVNLDEPDLQDAMQSQSSDGIPDTVRIDEFTWVDPDTLETQGTDHLTVIGSGTGKTFVTSSATSNIFVMNLDSNGRPTDMSDLTIVIPSSFPDGLGSALQAKDSNFDRVNIESRNPDSDAAASMIGDNTWNDSRIYGAMGGSIGFAFQPNGAGSEGELRISGTVIEDAIWGISAADPDVPIHLSRSRIVEPVGFGAFIGSGGTFTADNSVFEQGGLESIGVETGSAPGEQDAEVSVRNSTFVAGTDPAEAAIKLEVGSGFGSKSADVTVADSILRGYENTWEMIVPFGPGIGAGQMTFTDSNFKPAGLPDDGSASVDISDPGNIDQDPLFAAPGDYRLSPGSPSIDAGDPAPGGLLEDFAGDVRPLDGDGDGTRVRDQGAYEAAEIPTCQTDPALCPKPPPNTDTLAPKISKLKFRPPVRKKAGSLRFILSEAATVKATFKPTPKGKGKKKRKTVKFTKKAKAGANKVKIGKRKLKPGRYRMSIVATDAAGNRSKTITRKIKRRAGK